MLLTIAILSGLAYLLDIINFINSNKYFNNAFLHILFVVSCWNFCITLAIFGLLVACILAAVQIFESLNNLK